MPWTLWDAIADSLEPGVFYVVQTGCGLHALGSGGCHPQVLVGQVPLAHIQLMLTVTISTAIAQVL